MKIERITLRKVSLPLTSPYRVSFKTYETLEPIVVEVRGRDGEHGWGEAHIPTGSSFETQDSGWKFCTRQAPQLTGMSGEDALRHLNGILPAAPNAVSGLITAIEMAGGHPALEISKTFRAPLLIAVGAKAIADVEQEVEKHLADGYETLKVKVGWNVDEDLDRVEAVREAAKGRANISLDANRGFSREDGCRFASGLNPEIKYFEQPCPADDWDANAEVAAASTVPVMLDESITSLEAIDRAASIENVKAIKMKMKRIGGVTALLNAIGKARGLGLEVSIGDGVGTEISNWMEACLTRFDVTGAGEMNGFLKARTRLFVSPLKVEWGAILMTPGTSPEVDIKVLEDHTGEKIVYDAHPRHPSKAVAE